MKESIAENLKVLYLAGPFALLFLWIAKKAGYFRLPTPSTLDKIRLRYPILGFAVFIGTQLLVAPVITALWIVVAHPGALHGKKINLTHGETAWLNLIAIVSVGAVMLGFYYYLPKLVRDNVCREGMKKGFFYQLKSFCLGITSLIISYPLIAAVGQIASIFLIFFFQAPPIEQVVVKQLQNIKIYPIPFALTAASIVAMVPMIEEFLFRGLLQTWVVSRYGRAIGILFTAIVFTLFHFSTSQGLRNVEILFSLFTLALFLGFIYERQKTLWASIGLHASFNTLNVIFIFLG